MPVDLFEGTKEDQDSLVADIGRTIVSTSLTFGAHAAKGLTLGILDPTQKVKEYLGEEVYEAAPGWARTGAEIVGSVPTVMGTLGAARAVIPGTTVIPRFLQGVAAGAGLDVVHGLAEGAEPGEIAARAARGGLIFGGIEALLGVPAMVEKRSFRQLAKGLQPYEITAPQRALSPKAMNVAQDVEAFRYRTSPSPRTVARTMRGTASGEAAVIDEAVTKDWLTKKRGAGVMADPGPYTLQYVAEDGSVRLSTGEPAGMSVEDPTRLRWLDQRSGEVWTFPRKDFWGAKASPARNRLFRGAVQTHSFPENTFWESQYAAKDYTILLKQLRNSGQLSMRQAEAFVRYINPNVTGLKDMSLAEVDTLLELMHKGDLGLEGLRRITGLMRRGAAGAPEEQVLPDMLHELVGFMGKEASMVRLGFLAHFPPARFVGEMLSLKGGGVDWPVRIIKNFTDGMAEKMKIKIFLHRKFKGLFKGLKRGGRGAWFWELEMAIRRATRGLDPASKEYGKLKESTFTRYWLKATEKWGAEDARRMAAAYTESRFDITHMEENLIKAGVFGKYRHRKEHWSLLIGQEALLEDLYPNMPARAKELARNILKDLEKDPEKSYFRLLDSYVSSYTKLMYVKPAVDEMNRIINVTKGGRRVNPGVRKWFRHYAARQLGLPSETDYQLAETMGRGFRAMARTAPGRMVDNISGGYFKKFSAKDWLKISVFFNDLPYMAHLGLRPFAVARNLLQPTITTGSTIGNNWMIRGYHRAATDKAALKWMRDNQLFQQSLGEYEMALAQAPRKMDEFSRWLMYFFRKADELNRMASGLGFREKFDHFFPVVKAQVKGVPRGRPITEKFYTDIKLRRFRPSVRKEIRRLGKAFNAADEMEQYTLPAGSRYVKELEAIIERATGRKWMSMADIKEKMRVRLVGEAIGDTQWLYGKEHAPLFTYSFGAFGKQAGVYQTWWLNYAQFIKRLGTNMRKMPGEGRDWAPMATFFANNAMLVLGAMAAGWTGGKALRTVGFGPFPTEIPTAPAFAPIGHAATAMANMVFRQDIEKAEKNMETALKRAWDNWVPLSLVYRDFAKIGLAPRVKVGGVRLTPRPKYRGLTAPEKFGTLVGRGQK